MTINKHSKTLKGSLNITPGIAWGSPHLLGQQAPPGSAGTSWVSRHLLWSAGTSCGQQAPPVAAHTFLGYMLKYRSNIQ